MKVRNAINESNHELYDILVYYIIEKTGYSPKVRIALKELYKIVLDEINKEEHENLDVDLVDAKTFVTEQTDNGKINTIEIDWECFLLSDFLELYFGNKFGCYPKPIAELINKLYKETLNYIVKNGKYLEEDAVFTEIIREFNYEEDNK